jgi:hypothetical protein
MGASAEDAPMRTAIAALAVVLVVPAVGGAAAPSDTTAVRSVLLSQASLMKQGRWRQMYATYTPRYRARCPYSQFVQNGRQSRALLGPNFRLDRIQVRIRPGGRQALVSYRFVRNGRPLATVRFDHGDLYAKIGNRWFDEFDRVSAC